MFELPECVVLTRQMNETLRGKTVQRGVLGNSPHKFVWYNRSHEEFEKLTCGKRVGAASLTAARRSAASLTAARRCAASLTAARRCAASLTAARRSAASPTAARRCAASLTAARRCAAYARGRWMFVPLEPGYVLVLGECGGKLLYHPAGARLPQRYHLWLTFDDGSSLTETTQMWGAMELYEQGKELERQYIKDMRPTPLDPEFSFDYFSGLVDSLLKGEKRSVKGLLTQEQLVPGLGNSIAQDIMFRARLHPRRPLGELTKPQRRRLYDAILDSVNQAIAQGGRNDETDLYGQPGGYVRLLHAKSVGQPCPNCGTAIEKQAYLGGAVYFCPKCQET